MITRRRVVVAAIVLLGAVLVYGAWQTWSLYRNLDRAEASVDDLRAALDSGDREARDRAIADLKDHSGTAADRADGVWWDALTTLPVFGDDARAIQVISTTLDDVAAGGVEPLVESIDHLDGLSAGGRIDVDIVRSLQEPVAEAHGSLVAAAEDVEEVDRSGLVGSVRVRYDEYVEALTDAAGALGSAETAAEVLPGMLGAEGPRDYLLLFQNNAEIRATGGVPGSWALVHAEHGELRMVEQGSVKDFPPAPGPVLPLTEAERAVYGPELGIYFQNPGFGPDFPRAAELWQAHWDLRYPDRPIDGVLALDPVAMSYLIEGTGPVQVGDTTLTADNLVEELLSRPYVELAPQAQDRLFQQVARAIFDAMTADLASPTRFVEGLQRAADEGRLLVAPADAGDRELLEGSAVLGELRTDAGATPLVDIGLNDATASKMSYYLRHWADVRAQSCQDGRQVLDATLNLSQAISPSEAAELPDYLTGGGSYGTEPGTQLVAVRLYGPAGGTIDDLSLDGRKLDPAQVVELDGRPVVTVAVLIENTDDVVLTWSMHTGAGQTGDIELGMTPGVLPGDGHETFESAC